MSYIILITSWDLECMSFSCIFDVWVNVVRAYIDQGCTRMYVFFLHLWCVGCACLYWPRMYQEVDILPEVPDNYFIFLYKWNCDMMVKVRYQGHQPQPSHTPTGQTEDDRARIHIQLVITIINFHSVLVMNQYK